MTLGDEQFYIHHGDCIPYMLESMEPESVDCAIFSPPFPAMYAYTDSEADLGNVDEFNGESRIHFRFLFRGLRRVVKPGRVVAVHCCQIPRMKRTGGVGLFDFRGTLIRIAQRCGLIYEYDWLIPKNPQAQAIRSKSREMQFAGLESDRAKCRGALGDYIIKFRVPGDNAVPVASLGEVSRNNWIDWAEATWAGINETDTLNYAEGRDENDTRHICPLQLEVIRRLVLLYTNPGEIVFSPFAGVGSEGYMAIGGVSPKSGKRVEEPRRFIGCELKPSYYETAIANLTRAIESRAKQRDLFEVA